MPPKPPDRLADPTGARIARLAIIVNGPRRLRSAPPRTQRCRNPPHAAQRGGPAPIVDAGRGKRPPRGNTREPLRTGQRHAYDPARRRADAACRLGQTGQRLSGG